MSRRARALPAVLAASAALLAACGGGGTHKSASTASPTPSPSATSESPSASPSPTSAPEGAAALTGQAGPAGPVVVVKIDNAASARPLQHGLQAAAVVYQELVEGGATRYAAVYVGASHTDLGPIRSARITDIQLLAPYHHPIFGFSGANSGVLAQVRASALVTVPQEFNGGAYEQRGRRTEAYNFYTTPAALIAAAKPRTGSDAQDVGFRFGGPPASGGALVTGTLVATFSPYSQDRITWDSASQGWHITESGSTVHGTDGSPVAPKNILVQFVHLSPGKYVDVEGNNSPETATVGTGKAVLLRDGHRYDGQWVRGSMSSPTRWLTTDGHTLGLARGQTWVLLVPNTTSLSAG